MIVRSGFFAGAFVIAATIAVPVYALTMQECSAKYKAAQAAGTLNGMKWNDFRKAQCGPGATAAAPSPTATAPAPAPAPPPPPPAPAPAPTAPPPGLAVSRGAPPAPPPTGAPAGNAVFPTAV